jgi:riboflavin kinase/FMN adenylyltransferase
MIVARAFAEIRLDQAAVLAIGTFDGMHRGHAFLLEQARHRADELGCALVVVTFDPNPAAVLRPQLGRCQISSAVQKLRRLEALRVSLAVLLTFDVELSQLTAVAFMDALESRLGLREIWFGEDFHFGRNRDGDLPMLVARGSASGFSLHVVSRGLDERESVSSSRVRQAIAAGDMEAALPLLGYAFERECLGGNATQWLDGVTRSTRCAVPFPLLLPADGVYAVVSSTGERTLAAICSEQTGAELLVRGMPSRPAFSLEFVTRLDTAEEYSRQAANWDERAARLLDAWERPSFSPAGHH